MTRSTLPALIAVMAMSISGCAAAEPSNVPPPAIMDGGEDSVVSRQPVLGLQVGECLMDISTPVGQDLVDVPTISCEVPHESEVYAEIVLEGTGFPGVDQVTNRGVAGCMAEFADFVGLDYSSSRLDFTYYYPTPSSWAVGDRSVFCVVFDPGVLVEGTLAASQR